jgi:hypothetical protein
MALDLEEPFKYPGQVSRRDAYTSVFNHYLYLATQVFQAHRNASAVIGESDGIINQVI